MKFHLLPFFMVIIAVSTGHAQQKNFWTSFASTRSARMETQAIQADDKLFSLDLKGLKDVLATAPQRESAKERSSLVIGFPDENGSIAYYHVIESSVLHPKLAVRYPGIKSYAGQGIADPTSTIRFSLSDYDGLHAVILSTGKKTIHITPFTSDWVGYRVYVEHDVKPTFECGTHETSATKRSAESKVASNGRQSDRRLRIYRVALSCGAEYGNLYAGSSGTTAQKKARILAQMNNTITQVSAIYERDLSIILQIVNDTDKTIFFGDVASDPFPNLDIMNGASGAAYDNVCMQVIIDNYAAGTYDLGHHFNLSSREAGLACIGCVCQAGSAYAYSVGADPSNTVYPLVVAHEMGHQFGAYHVQSSNMCISGNGESEVEPGAGSTIMGYSATPCEPKMQKVPDGYFNYINIKEISDYIYSQSCGFNLGLSNNPPVANAGADYTIPKSTPFLLKGQASDPDGNALTYTWEQNDPQDYNTLDSGTPQPSKSSGPMIRSLPMSSSPNRSIPSLDFVLANRMNVWEVLPAVSRKLNFAFTVRDNVAGGGQVGSDLMAVTVDGNSGPFRIISNNGPLVWSAGASATITWDVAGTNAAPVNCSNVKISLSTDGGQTFPTVLVSSTPNDGSQTITVPSNVSSSVCRLKIEAVNNIFYDISDVDFTINQNSCIVNVPTGVFPQRIETQAVTFNWVRSNNTYYELRYRVSPTGSWTTWIVFDQPGNYYMSQRVTGFSPNTNYQAQIRSACNAGTSTIVIRARGTSGQEHVNLRINNNLVAGFNLTTSMQNYTFTTGALGGITVQFDNDQSNRDVQIDYVQVNGQVRQSEDQTYNTGVYVNGACGGSNSEWLHCNGVIGYGDVTGASGTVFSNWSDLVSFFTIDGTYNVDDVNTLLAIDRNCDKANMLNWNVTTDISKWNGINWSATTPKRVTDLNLQSMELTGTLDAGTMTQLQWIGCDYNHLAGLKVSGATALQNIYCNYNEIEQLDVSSLQLLGDMSCNNNHLTSLNLGSINQLLSLKCESNFLPMLNVNSLVNVKYLSCAANSITALDVGKLAKATYIGCGANLLTSLSFSNLPNLSFISCSNNRLTSLTLDRLPMLSSLSCGSNQLTSINGLTNLTNLGDLSVNKNNFASLDVTRNINLTLLNAEYNKLSSLILPSPSKLATLYCGNNMLTQLSLKGQIQLTALFCDGNKLSSFVIDGSRKSLDQSTCTYNNLPFSQLYKLNVPSDKYAINPQNEIFNPAAYPSDIIMDYAIEATVGGVRTSFVFYKNDVVLGSSTSGRYATSGPGIYYCVMTNGFFPGVTLTTAKINIGNVPIPASMASQITGNLSMTPNAVSTQQSWMPVIYPNPANTSMHIELPASEESAQIALYAISGYPVRLSEDVSSSVELDLRDLQTGVYILKVITSKGAFEKRVIIAR